MKALRRAQRDGLAFRYPMDQLLKYTTLWLDSETVKAKVGELYVHDGRYGLAFVAPGPFFADGSYKLAPILVQEDGREQVVPTLLCVLPRETMGRVRSAPRERRIETLLLLESHRVAAMWRALGQPVPPEVQAFFEESGTGPDDLEEQ